MGMFDFSTSINTCSKHNYTGTKECPHCKSDNLLHEVMQYYEANINAIIHERFVVRDKNGKVIKNCTVERRK